MLSNSDFVKKLWKAFRIEKSLYFILRSKSDKSYFKQQLKLLDKLREMLIQFQTELQMLDLVIRSKQVKLG